MNQLSSYLLQFFVLACFAITGCTKLESKSESSELNTEAASCPPKKISRITVNIANNALYVGETTTANAVVLDTSGQPMPSCSVTWSTSNSFVASLSNSTTLSTSIAGSSPGTSAIIASKAGVAGSANLTVELLPQPSPAPSPTPSPAPSPSPAPGSIWGTVDPVILGTCSAEVHDRYVADGGDGFFYRTWHPQGDPSGCRFAHEHGDNPLSVNNSEIASSPVLFGYAAKRHIISTEPNGHMEAHEGYKVFVANPGDVNDEGRVNRVYSRSVFHMGTGGPKRFANRFHSADIKLIHPEFGLKAFTNLMMDTGGVGAVCDPRVSAPVKDVVNLQSPCMLGSFYEIWSTIGIVRFQGREIYRAFATPAVFDPITVFNPANPTELVYAWDPRVESIMQFPNNSRDRFRGCDRESYAQPGYWYNNTGRTEFYTDAMGNEVLPTDSMAIKQVISLSQSVGSPATNDGLAAFKMRKNYCGTGLGWKN